MMTSSKRWRILAPAVAVLTTCAALTTGCSHAAPRIAPPNLALAAQVAGTNADWHPAPGPLATRRSNSVSTTNALPEYPRPQMARAAWRTLNGLWGYSLTDAAATNAPADADQHVWLSSLDLTKAVQGWGTPGADRSAAGNPIMLSGKTYARGFGTHSPGYLAVDLSGVATRFTATVGIDDEVPAGKGSAEFIVLDTHHKALWRSGILRRGDAPKTVDLDIRGQRRITLLVTDGGDGYEDDHADWADAQFTTSGGTIQTVAQTASSAPPVIAPAGESPAPAFHGPAVVGVLTGTPLIWKAPVTGARPLRFAAEGLPPGVKLDPASGILSGTPQAGDFALALSAANRAGTAHRIIHLRVGDEIALTPPMGWNSYDCFGDDVTETEVLANAQYVADHLQPYGWDTIVVDYRWYDPRASDQPNNANIGHQALLTMDGNGRLLPAPNRFPSASDGHGFRALATRIHALGLRFGIHIMRGIPREAVTENLPIDGSDYHAQDAADTAAGCAWCDDMWGVRGDTPAGKAYYASLFRLYAAWGVDYVKMDDTSAPYRANEIEAAHSGIAASGRSIVYSLSPGETPIEQAAHVADHANSWRVSSDFWDGWSALDHEFTLAARWDAVAAPGHWPDADMLPLGHLSVRGRSVGPDRRTNFSRPEQMTLVSFWSLLASPLMVGADLPDDDAWTTALLTNPEVLALDQDTFMEPARPIANSDDDGSSAVWARRLSDGSVAVGLFNRDAWDRQVSVSLAALGLTGRYAVRDLWQRKDLGVVSNEIAADVPSHGVVLYRLEKVK